MGERAITRAGLLRAVGAVLAAGTGAALAACGAGGGAGQGPALVKPAAPVEVEYWSTLADSHPTEKGRMDALRLAEKANAEYFKIKFSELAGADITKMVAALAAGTPPNLVIDYPYWAARLH